MIDRQKAPYLMFFQKLSVSSQWQCPEEMERMRGKRKDTKGRKRERGGGGGELLVYKNEPGGTLKCIKHTRIIYTVIAVTAL